LTCSLTRPARKNGAPSMAARNILALRTGRALEPSVTATAG
jgi:hypothetical protein